LPTEELQTIPIGSFNFDDPRHGQTVSGDKACCRRSSFGVIDCAGCLDDAREQLTSWSDEGRRLGNSIIDLADARGDTGLPLTELLVSSRKIIAGAFLTG
jgi:hypothetical protein